MTQIAKGYVTGVFHLFKHKTKMIPISTVPMNEIIHDQRTKMVDSGYMLTCQNITFWSGVGVTL